MHFSLCVCFCLCEFMAFSWVVVLCFSPLSLCPPALCLSLRVAPSVCLSPSLSLSVSLHITSSISRLSSGIFYGKYNSHVSSRYSSPCNHCRVFITVCVCVCCMLVSWLCQGGRLLSPNGVRVVPWTYTLQELIKPHSRTLNCFIGRHRHIRLEDWR